MGRIAGEKMTNGGLQDALRGLLDPENRFKKEASLGKKCRFFIRFPGFTAAVKTLGENPRTGL